MESSPVSKRKKYYSKGEIIEKLRENNFKIKECFYEICEEMCPFDVSDEDALQIEDRLNRLEKVSKNLTAKVSRLSKAYKAKVFRHKPEMLEDKEISSSQYSLFQSDESQKELESQEGMSALTLSNESDNCSEDEKPGVTRPKTYIRKPLNSKMSQKTRHRRVLAKRETLSMWAIEEGISTTELLGYLLYLENYHEGAERNISAVGWKIFLGGKISEKNSASLEEALWMIELGFLSQAV